MAIKVNPIFSPTGVDFSRASSQSKLFSVL